MNFSRCDGVLMFPAWWSQIDAENRQQLLSWGFDPVVMETLRQKVVSREISPEHNCCYPAPQPPEPDNLAYMPVKGSQPYQHFYEMGCHALAAGKVGVAILNGGMATRLGGMVKGTVEVAHRQSFLELKMDDVRAWQQRLGGRIPVFLVNSFATDTLTKEHLENQKDIEIHYLEQGVSLRLDVDGNIFFPEPGMVSPYAPGHGDMLRAWLDCPGAMEWGREEGRILLIGNVDNIFYKINPVIIGIFMNHRQMLLAETVEKLPNDIGGAPVWYQNRLQTIEGFRFPPGFDQSQIPVFATNSFVVQANVLSREWNLDWFYVLKNVHEHRLLQLEKLVNQLTAFVDTTFLVVPRTGEDGRFLAVKTAADMEQARQYFNKDSLR